MFEEPAPPAAGDAGAPASARAPPRFRIFDARAQRSYTLVQRLAREGVIPRECSSALAAQLFNRGLAATVISRPWFAGGVEP